MNMIPKPLPTDHAAMLLTECLGVLRLWKFCDETQSAKPLTPRALDELRTSRADVIEKIDRWAANKPEYQKARSPETDPVIRRIDEIQQAAGDTLEPETVKLMELAKEAQRTGEMPDLSCIRQPFEAPCAQ